MSHQRPQDAQHATHSPCTNHATHLRDLFSAEALANSQPDKRITSQTKTALHRTRLRFLDHKNFSVLFFFKPDRQTAPVLAALRKTETEKIEKNFSVFHFCGSLINFK
ncbi:hypothetical protein [Enterobacter sp. BNK-22]|uniref:hypothetical protein n=1 Tax=Enterobacter sp. BNK-22 TaxID=3376157 RepID=UPI003B50727B